MPETWARMHGIGKWQPAAFVTCSDRLVDGYVHGEAVFTKTACVRLNKYLCGKAVVNEAFAGSLCLSRRRLAEPPHLILPEGTYRAQ